MNSVAEITKSETDQDFNEIKSASIKKITWSNASWCLRLYPNCTHSFSFGCIGLTIVRLSSSVPRHTLEYSLLSKNSVRNVHFKVAHFDVDHTEIGEMNFISRYVPQEFSPSSLRESIEVTCILTCYGSHAVDTISPTEFSVKDDAKDVGALCHDLKKMLLNGQNHDVVLKVKDKEFRAHRDLLRARSPVFESMLSHDMIEKNSGAIDIPDCDPSAFEQFLVYLYSGGMETWDTGNMLSLYYVADKYDMVRLKEECREFIKKSLSASNITDVVQLALDHSDAVLLRWATDYFVREVDKILPTVEWLSFMKSNTVQANELIIKLRKHTT